MQTETLRSTTEAEYISLYQAMRDVLKFISLMKNIEFVLDRIQDSLCNKSYV